MNITNIKVGKRFKSYIALCKELGIAPRGKANDNTRKAQEKEIKQYFDYITNRNTIIITEVFDEIKPLVRNKGGRKPMYYNDMEKMIIDLLYETHKTRPDITQSFATSKLMEATGMINGDYKEFRNKVPKLSKMLGIEEEVVYEFYSTTNVELLRKLERTLRQLANRKELVWEYSLNVCKLKVVDVELTPDGEVAVDSNNIPKIRYTRVHEEATDEEKKYLLTLEKEVLKSMKLKNYKSVFLTGRGEEYKTLVNQKLKDENTNIEYFYKTYKFIYCFDILEEAYNQIQKDMGEALTDIPTHFLNMNNNVVKSLKKGQDTKHKNAVIKINNHKDVKGFGVIANEKRVNQKRDVIRSKENYVADNSKLTDKLVKTNKYKKVTDTKYEQLDFFGGQEE